MYVETRISNEPGLVFFLSLKMEEAIFYPNMFS